MLHVPVSNQYDLLGHVSYKGLLYSPLVTRSLKGWKLADCKLKQLIPIRCDRAANHIPQCSHPSFPRKRESIRLTSENTAASHKNGITSA